MTRQGDEDAQGKGAPGGEDAQGKGAPGDEERRGGAPRESKEPRGKTERSARGETLRGLAAVDTVLREPAVAALAQQYPRDLVVTAVRTVVDRLRREILEGGSTQGAGDVTPASLAPWIEALVRKAASPSLREVINATGIVAHTNLGRTTLPAESLAALQLAAGSYTDLELDLSSGERASRQDHVHDVLTTLTGAEDALVVNNNAAAVLLALAATARGGEVLVSRGQLVEIGDGFRIPDILAESGAELVEVGTTNRTYLRDFERAWTARSRAILRVHTSNYRIVGFTSEPTLEELAVCAHRHDSVLVDDLGSGALAPLELFAEEPAVGAGRQAGADVVTFSGDKMLGGPQAGIAVGRAAIIDLMRRHPLARAMRIDKLGIAALDALLRLYLDPEHVVERVPALAMLAAPLGIVQARAEALRNALLCEGGGLSEADLAIVPSVARAGAGALPVTDVESVAVAVSPPGGDSEGFAARLRSGRPAVVGRIHEGRLLLDVRTVRDEETAALAAAVLAALQ